MDEDLNEPAPAWVWALELAILGGVGGTVAPVSALLFWMWLGPPFVSVDLTGAFVSGGVCCALGLGLGAAAAWASQQLSGLGYLLLPMGFPLGSVAGGVAAYATLHTMFTPRILREILVEGTLMGVTTAGLTLGLVWAPWVVLHRRGRPRWPLLLLASVGIPFLAASVMAAPVVMAWAT